LIFEKWILFYRPPFVPSTRRSPFLAFRFPPPQAISRGVLVPKGFTPLTHAPMPYLTASSKCRAIIRSVEIVGLSRLSSSAFRGMHPFFPLPPWPGGRLWKVWSGRSYLGRSSLPRPGFLFRRPFFFTPTQPSNLA